MKRHAEIIDWFFLIFETVVNVNSDISVALLVMLLVKLKVD